MNDILIKALNCEKTQRTPAWMMRQAGRHLPEYRQLRAEAGSFMNLCKTPKLAAEATLQPLRRYKNLDAAILFSDILTIPDAMGMDLYFESGEGPKFKKEVKTINEIENLEPAKIQDLSYVFETVQTIKTQLTNKPLIGFAGSPWTIATYIIEGGSSRDFKKTKFHLYENPQVLHNLLKKITISTSAYLIEQIKSGVDAVQIFDSWGGALSFRAYEEFSLSYMQIIINNIKEVYPQIPIILFTKGAGNYLESIIKTNTNAIGLDWTCSLQVARDKIDSKKIALQGNLDPAILNASEKVIIAEVQKVLADFGEVRENAGHIFNLGHGITPDVKPESVEIFFNAIAEFSPQYHK